MPIPPPGQGSKLSAPDMSNPISQRDNLFANPLGAVRGFMFDQAVVDVFPDMISRSVPGYETIIAHTGELAARFVQRLFTIHISEPTRPERISYAVFCLKKKHAEQVCGGTAHVELPVELQTHGT